jgi:sRNA-binding carbon storage regulator CsrA
MLKFSVRPGEAFMIGDEIKVVFLGGMANNCRVMVEAPRSYNIVRNSVLEKNASGRANKKTPKHYYPEPKLSDKDLQRYKDQQERNREAMWWQDRITGKMPDEMTGE